MLVSDLITLLKRSIKTLSLLKNSYLTLLNIGEVLKVTAGQM